MKEQDFECYFKKFVWNLQSYQDNSVLNKKHTTPPRSNMTARNSLLFIKFNLVVWSLLLTDFEKKKRLRINIFARFARDFSLSLLLDMSVSLLVLVLALASISLSVSAKKVTSTRDLFSQWKSQYNKSYETPELEESRFANFQLSLERVQRLSSRRTVEGGAKFGLTIFSGIRSSYFKSLRSYSTLHLSLNSLNLLISYLRHLILFRLIHSVISNL